MAYTTGTYRRGGYQKHKQNAGWKEPTLAQKGVLAKLGRSTMGYWIAGETEVELRVVSKRTRIAENLDKRILRPW